jgi:hypothetical protein
VALKRKADVPDIRKAKTALERKADVPDIRKAKTALERKADVHVPDIHNDDKLGSELREVTGRLQDDVKGEEGVQRVRQARPAPGLCALN